MLLWLLGLFIVVLLVCRYKEVTSIGLLILLLLITENVLASILISLVVYVLLYVLERNEDREHQ